MYLFRNFNGGAVDVWEWACDYSSMLGLNLNHVIEMGPWVDMALINNL